MYYFTWLLLAAVFIILAIVFTTSRMIAEEADKKEAGDAAPDLDKQTTGSRRDKNAGGGIQVAYLRLVKRGIAAVGAGRKSNPNPNSNRENMNSNSDRSTSRRHSTVNK